MSDSKQFQVKLPADLMDKFDGISAMTGITKVAVIQQAVERFVSAYEDSNGQFNPMPGKIVLDTGVCDGDVIPQVEQKCVILNKCFMFGKPYVTVYSDCHVYKVPADRVIEG